MPQEVVITFSETGPEVQVEARGVVGKACTALTKPFEEALGAVLDTSFKPEYYRPTATITNKVTAQG